MRTLPALAVLAALAAVPPEAFAQRFPFERTLSVTDSSTLDVSTVRGKIEVLAGDPGRITVEGVATVRAGWNVPANAVELARQLAASPPIDQAGSILKLGMPRDAETQRAVTISYRVHVPPKTEVLTTSESGETAIRGTAARVNVRTQSGAITVDNLSGDVKIATGSGAVTAGDIAGALSVTTTSSAFSGAGLGSSLRVRTESGSVDATFHGDGDADVETGSSAIALRGVRGGVTVKTQSGHVTLQGVPLEDWTATTGSSSVKLDLGRSEGFHLDAASRSGDVTLDGIDLTGTTKHQAAGKIGTGGPTVRARTGSGAIRIQVAGAGR